MSEEIRGGAPSRVQLSRAKGWRMPPNTVKVDRTTKWGNPFNWKDLPTFYTDSDGDDWRVSDDNRRYYATCDFESAVSLNIGRPANYPSNDEIRRELRGKNLACWCPLDGPCHADVLLALANGTDERSTSAEGRRANTETTPAELTQEAET